MNIWLLAENWPPRIGGIERYLVGLTRQLSRRHTVHVFAPAAPEESGRAANSTSDNDKHRVARMRFFTSLLRPRWLFLGVRLCIRAIFGRPDTFLAGKALFEGLVGYYLKQILGVPYVVFTYGMEIHEWRNNKRTERTLRKVISGADRVVFINQHTKEQLITLGARGEQLIYLPPGIDAEAFARRSHAAGARVQDEYNLPERYILCVARLIPRKGIDDLIYAFARISSDESIQNYTLVIAGDGPERGALEALASRTGARVRFLGAVPDEDLPGLYANADMFGLTPKDIAGDIEGFGIVYLEAAAAGIPSIATSSGGANEAVVHTKTGLVAEEGDIERIAAAIHDLASDEEVRARLGRQAQTRVRAEYSWSTRARVLERDLRSLAE